MTTIVYRNGVMASDSAVTDSGGMVGETDKVFRVRGHLVGGCGSLGAVLAFVEWFRAGADPDKRPKMDDAFDTLVVTPEGVVNWYDCELIASEFRAPFHAIGSGHKIALGALHMGASARQAVKIACMVDNASGGKIKTLRLKK